MTDGQFIERGTLDLWSDTMQEQRDTIARLRADLAQPAQVRVLALRDAGYDTPSIKPQPDLRDEVINGLVEALEGYKSRSRRIPFDLAVSSDAALAAAKAVQK